MSAWLSISSTSYAVSSYVAFVSARSYPPLPSCFPHFVFPSLFRKIHIRIKIPWWRAIFRGRDISASFSPSLVSDALLSVRSPLRRLSGMCYIVGLMHSPISLIKARVHRWYLPLISPSSGRAANRIACSRCVSLASGRWIGCNALGRIPTDQSAAKCGRT